MKIIVIGLLLVGIASLVTFFFPMAFLALPVAVLFCLAYAFNGRAVAMHFGLAGIALVLLLGSIFGTIHVTTQNKLRDLEFGSPLPFVLQVSAYDPPLPHDLWIGDPRENPSRIIWGNLFMDFVIVFGALEVLWLVYKSFLQSHPNKP